jgi:hypothetical protein
MSHVYTNSFVEYRSIVIKIDRLKPSNLTPKNKPRSSTYLQVQALRRVVDLVHTDQKCTGELKINRECKIHLQRIRYVLEKPTDFCLLRGTHYAKIARSPLGSGMEQDVGRKVSSQLPKDLATEHKKKKSDPTVASNYAEELS